jgi:hypothetical protein
MTRPAKASRSAPPASERAQTEWLRRVEAEYRSAAITGQLVLWLIQIGCSPDLIRDGLRIVDDELVHAEDAHGVYRAAGGSGVPALDREALGLVRRAREPIEHDVARAAVEVFCLGETVAVRLFKELRAKCREPAARRALDRVLEDEVRHRDFGWLLFEWLAESPLGPDLIALVERELAQMFQRLSGAYAPGAVRNERSMDPADRAWGLMPGGLYASILEEVLERDYVPRFAAFGIDANAAWAARKAPGRG